jgi:pectate lyase
MPRVRFGRVHLYNNYYNAPGNNYCIRAALHSEILSEGNHFENADEPFEFFGDKGSRPPGKIRDVGSTLVNCTNIYAATDTVFTPPYAYKPDPVNQVPAIVQARAGAGKIPIRDDEGARPSTEGQSK